MESTSSFPIGFKCQSRGNRVTVDEQGDVQFWPVGGGPTWVTSWPLLSWWPGYSKHLPLFQTSQLFWQQHQERGLQREGPPVWKGVQCIGHLQGPGGSWAVSQLTSQQRQGQRAPAPLHVAIASGTARVPLHSSPRTSESVGPGPECQCDFKSTPS